MLDMWVCPNSNFWMEPCEILKPSLGSAEKSRTNKRAGGLQISRQVKRKKANSGGKIHCPD